MFNDYFHLSSSYGPDEDGLASGRATPDSTENNVGGKGKKPRAEPWVVVFLSDKTSEKENHINRTCRIKNCLR